MGMLEHSYDPNELGLLEEHEFNCKTAVISARSAEMVKAAQAEAIMTLESSGSEISFTNEGYSFDVNYTANHSHCSLEILLLETGDDHPTPNHIAIMYNKLNGDSYTFQRFYRESVALLAKDLTDLRALNGTHLPTMEVMADNFDRSDLPDAQNVVQTLQQVIQKLEQSAKENTVESMRETTAILVQLASKHPMPVLEFLAQPQLVMAIKELLREKSGSQISGHRDFAVCRNFLRMFNAVISEEVFDVVNKYKVCQNIVGCQLFEIICDAAVWWTQQEGEVLGKAKVISRDIGSFLMNITRDFYGQNGWPASAESKASLKKISGFTVGGYFENFRKTVVSVLGILNKN